MGTVVFPRLSQYTVTIGHSGRWSVTRRRVPYLMLRGTTYQVRLPIPKRMHDLFGRKEIQRSLHTRDPSVARCLALQAGSRFIDLCDSIVAMGEVSESDINKLIDGFFRTLVANHSVPDPVEPGAYDWDMNRQSAAAEEMQAELAAMAAHRDYSSDIKQEASNLLDAIGTEPADLTKCPPSATMRQIGKIA